MIQFSEASEFDLPVRHFPVQPLREKYFAGAVGQIKTRTPAVPARKRGVRTSRTLGRDAMDAMAPLTMALVADGKAVWSWRPDAGVKCRGVFRGATVARKPGHRGERGISRKTIAQGMPDCLR